MCLGEQWILISHQTKKKVLNCLDTLLWKTFKVQRVKIGKHLLLNQIKDYFLNKPQKPKLKGKCRHIWFH